MSHKIIDMVHMRTPICASDLLIKCFFRIKMMTMLYIVIANATIVFCYSHLIYDVQQ